MRRLIMARCWALALGSSWGASSQFTPGIPCVGTDQLIFTSEDLRALCERVGTVLVPGSARPHDSRAFTAA